MLYDSVYILHTPVCYPTRSRQFGGGMLEVASHTIPVTYVLGRWPNCLGVDDPNYLCIAYDAFTQL